MIIGIERINNKNFKDKFLNLKLIKDFHKEFQKKNKIKKKNFKKNKFLKQNLLIKKIKKFN